MCLPRPGDGVVLPCTSTYTLAEAGMQLHRLHSSANYAVNVDHIVVVVRGYDPNAKDYCVKWLAETFEKIVEVIHIFWVSLFISFGFLLSLCLFMLIKMPRIASVPSLKWLQ